MIVKIIPVKSQEAMGIAYLYMALILFVLILIFKKLRESAIAVESLKGRFA